MEDKESNYEDAQEEAPEDAPQEAQEEKQTTEDILETATLTATVEDTEVAAETTGDIEVIDNKVGKQDTEVADKKLQLPVAYTQEQIEEQEIQKNIALIFQTSKMEYLQYEMMMDNGRTIELSDEHQVDESPSAFQDYGSPVAFATSR